MTESRINSFKKGTRCKICTGCGRCFGVKKMDAVSSFRVENQAVSDGEKESMQACTQYGAQTGFLVAVDIGTTTIAMQLRNMENGAVADTYTCINPQRQYGADVLSRIRAAEDPVAKAGMKHAVREVLQQGISRFQKKLTQMHDAAENACAQSDGTMPAGWRIHRMAVAANTTMLHLLMGYDTSGLGSYPFQPQTLECVHTKMFGIDTVLLPGISAFVGADITAGIFALSMHRRQEVTLLLDLGTNGEMVLGCKEGLLATATAAGPAFEGGAEYYGTDLMALTARLLKEGLLDETGLLTEPYFETGIDIGGIHLAQQDIRKLQMAKAAISAGIRILCRKYGLRDFREIDRVWLAGGMGYYLDASAAAAIGLIPKELEDRTVAVGNAALEGAFLFGRNEEPLSCRTEEFNLAEEPEFDREYVDAMTLAVSPLHIF